MAANFGLEDTFGRDKKGYPAARGRGRWRAQGERLAKSGWLLALFSRGEASSSLSDCRNNYNRDIETFTP